MIYFSADTHFRHANIARHCNRPWAAGYVDEDNEWLSKEAKNTCAVEMDEALISIWNQIVSPEDDVYHLGDFAFHGTRVTVEPLVARLNGRIRLILGNHDARGVRNATEFVWVKKEHTMILDGVKLYLSHRYNWQWTGKESGTWHLHGHSHSKYFRSNLSLDVGIDGHDYEPMPWERVQEIIHQSYRPSRFQPGRCN